MTLIVNYENSFVFITPRSNFLKYFPSQLRHSPFSRSLSDSDTESGFEFSLRNIEGVWSGSYPTLLRSMQTWYGPLLKVQWLYLIFHCNLIIPIKESTSENAHVWIVGKGRDAAGGGKYMKYIAYIALSDNLPLSRTKPLVFFIFSSFEVAQL